MIAGKLWHGLYRRSKMQSWRRHRADAVDNNDEAE